jgi:CRISPR-associated endonuclease/helicase Cas3
MEYGKLLPKRDLETFRDAADPHLAEQLETESRSVFEWLSKRTKAFVAQRRQEAASESEEAEKVHLIPLAVLFDEDNRPHVVRSSDFASKKERDALQDLLRGATLLVDRRLGGLRNGLLDTDVDEAIDVTEVGDIGEEGPRRVPFRVRRVEAEEETPEGWRTEARIPVSKSEEGDTEWLVIESVAGGLAESEEGRSTATQPQLLDKHQEWTEEEAQAIATNLALPSEYIELLKTAARLHDEGKKADRWQRAFNAPNGGKPPYAKTRGRPNLALLEGYRHELGSLPYAEAHSRTKSLPSPLRELCLHVVAAHHGHARPLLRTTAAPEPPSRLIERAQEVALRFAALEKLWGPWGLAWWEALLRAADQRASRRNDAEGGRRG